MTKDPVSVKEPFEGSCLCGALKFRIRPPSKWCAHCHCSLCRRAHGAGFVTWIGVESPQFELVALESLRWFESSPGARRGFCGICGSSLLFESTRWPGEMHIARASIPGPIDREPAAHVYTRSAVSWCELDDRLPRRP